MNVENFEVCAFFYNENNHKNGFRRYLEIKRKNTSVTENDLNVIMMNPGSSQPKNSNLEYLNRFVEANPDTTQYQIMRVMDKCNLDFAKVINLSDIRESRSQNFYEFLKTGLSENYSIFSDINEDVLKNYLNQKSIFIFAWGVNKKLNKLSEQAILKLYKLYGNEIQTCGWKHKINNFGYYHPLPKRNDCQIEWVNKISEQIKILQSKLQIED